jgi:hypothetical protein
MPVGRHSGYDMTRLVLGSVATSLLLLASACGEDQRNPADIPAEELVTPGCDEDEDCPGGYCIAGIGEGLCTADCTQQEHCPQGTICTDTENENGGVCLLACSESSYCRDLLGSAYNCDTESSYTSGEDVRVCIDGA